MAGQIKVFDGDSDFVLAFFDAGSSGVAVLGELRQGGRAGRLVCVATECTITIDSVNLVVGEYRFYRVEGGRHAGSGGGTPYAETSSSGKPIVHGVPQDEGVKLSKFVAKRSRFLRKLLKRLLTARVVLIKAPPQTGKTSVLQLVEDELDWASTYAGADIQLFYVTMLCQSDLSAALKAKYPVLLPQGWDSFASMCKTPETSAAGAEPQQARNSVVLLCVDEAQMLWAGHDWLWQSLKLDKQGSRRQRMHVLLCAAYGDGPSGFPHSQADASVMECEYGDSPLAAGVSARSLSSVMQDVAAAAAQGGQRQLQQLVATPFVLDPSQVVQVLPAKAARSGEELTLTASWEEWQELLGAWGKVYGLSLNSSVQEWIYEVTGGQFGALSLTLCYLGEEIVNDLKADPNVAACYKLTLPSYINRLSHLRSVPRLANLGSLGFEVVKRLLVGQSLNDAFGPCSDRQQAAQWLCKCGLLTELEGVPPQHSFTSPIHELICAQRLYLRRAERIDSLEDCVRKLIPQLNPTILAGSFGRTRATRRPLEGVYHHEVYKALAGLLPCGPDLEMPIISTYVGQLFGAAGYLDLFVGPPWGWGFEFVRDGDKVQEHTDRFQPGGRYYPMVECSLLKAMVVMDMRADTAGRPDQCPSSGNVKVIHVCFHEGYERATVYGLGEQPEVLPVAGQQPQQWRKDVHETGIIAASKAVHARIVQPDVGFKAVAFKARGLIPLLQ